MNRFPLLALVALAFADQDFAMLGVEILDPQPYRLHEPQTRAVEQPRNQAIGAVHPAEYRIDFGAGKHHGQALRTLGAFHVFQPWQFRAEHLLVEKQQGALGLVLG